MRLGQELVQRPEQRLLLLPKMLQSIEILQLGTADLLEAVSQALSENELLTLDVSDLDPAPPVAPAEAGPGSGAGEHADPYDSPRRKHSSSEAADRKQMALLNTAAPEQGLREYLLQQASLAELDPQLEAAVLLVIDHIDPETGWLEVDLAELDAGGEAELDRATWDAAVSFVQQLEPRGVGGRGSIECLLLQLDERDPQERLVCRLLREFLEDVAKNRLPKVARKLGISLEDLKDGIEHMRTLDARPGAAFQSVGAPYITPEVVVEWCGADGYEVHVDDAGLPRLKIDGEYRGLINDRSVDSEYRGYLRQKLDSARWLIDAVEQRKTTLLRVAEALFAQQQEFLDRGPTHIAPLRMQELAEALELHVSTVSRTVAGKYVQTHWGIFPMRHFFTGSTQRARGPAASRIEVMEAVRCIVASEDGAAPLSDDEIVQKLAVREGLKVARRTVTKYRKELGIPSSWRRKRY